MRFPLPLLALTFAGGIGLCDATAYYVSPDHTPQDYQVLDAIAADNMAQRFQASDTPSLSPNALLARCAPVSHFVSIFGSPGGPVSMTPANVPSSDLPGRVYISPEFRAEKNFVPKVDSFLSEDCVDMTQVSAVFIPAAVDTQDVYMSVGDRPLNGHRQGVMLFINEKNWQALDQNDNLLRLVLLHEEHHIYRDLKDPGWINERVLKITSQIRFNILKREFVTRNSRNPQASELEAIKQQVDLEAKGYPMFEKLRQDVQKVFLAKEELAADNYAWKRYVNRYGAPDQPELYSQILDYSTRNEIHRREALKDMPDDERNEFEKLTASDKDPVPAPSNGGTCGF